MMNQNPLNRPQVTHYTDYRSFLLGYAQWKKKHRPTWSYGVWARELGLKSTSSITKVLQGNRNLGDSLTNKLTHYFQFSKSETSYFKKLVQLHRIKADPELSLALMGNLNKQQPNTKTKHMTEKEFTEICRWYYFVLHEMVRMNEFEEDPNWISSALLQEVPHRDLSLAIDRLLKLGVLVRDSKGRLKSRLGRVASPHEVPSQALRRYHSEMLDNAKKALMDLSIEDRLIVSSTIVMNSSNLRAAKEMLLNFKKEFVKTFEEEGGDSVFQIQLQHFPLTIRHLKRKKEQK